MESAYIGSPKSLVGDEGREEGEYTGEERDENEPEEEESTTPQAMKTMKSTKPGGGESTKGGVDG